ncbi:MAG: hypothetical protein QMD86_02875 [Patescibacteria group bacterium]|nr:hypothetical protein [Patescibacteria group bacterium]
MIKTEKKLTSAFHYFLRKQKPLPLFLTKSFAIEFKWLKKNRLNFKSDIQACQVPSLLQVKNSCFYSKISDQSLGLKGFDGFNICGADAWLAIAWNKTLYFLDINFIEKFMRKNKSISKQEIILYAKEQINLI